MSEFTKSKKAISLVSSSLFVLLQLSCNSSVENRGLLPSAPAVSYPSSWAKQFGASTPVPGGDTSNSDWCVASALDSAGNIYCVGNTSGAMGEAPGGNLDPFVMKLNPAGAIQWITQLGAVTHAVGGTNSGDDRARTIAIDSSGNIFVGGSTSGSMGEGNGGSDDIFVFKLNSAGALQWVRQLGSVTPVPGGSTANSESCRSLALDSSGNIYCGGSTDSDLGEAHAGTDAFVLKLNSSGVVQWLKQLGSVTPVPGGNTSFNDYCYGIAVDSSDNVYCGGITTGALGESPALATNGDTFVMKLNSAGTLQWIRQLGATTVVPGGDSTGGDSCRGVTVDSSDNIYCAGYATSAIGETFSGGTGDAFIMKLNSSGIVQWIRQLGAVTVTPGGNATNSDFCNSVTTDSGGNVYCAGETAGSLGEANGGGANRDGFVMKMSSTGALQWIRQFGSTTKGSITGDASNYETFLGISINSSGQIYVAGEADGNFAEPDGGSNNGDALVVKLKPDGTFAY